MLNLFLDWLYPKHCVNCNNIGSYLCSKCERQIKYFQFPLCPNCGRQIEKLGIHPYCAKDMYLDGLIAVGEYRGALGNLIKRLKYSGQFNVVQTAVKLMSQKIPQYKIDNLILVPVPLHAKKLKIRGYNQSKLLASGLAHKFRLRSLDLLVKTKNTQPQAGLNREQRLKNLQGVFALKKRKIISFKIPAVLLIDDVVTTSTTLNECAKILKNAGIKQVFGLALAHGK